MRKVCKLPVIILTLTLGLCSALADGSNGVGPSKPMSSSASSSLASSVFVTVLTPTPGL